MPPERQSRMKLRAVVGKDMMRMGSDQDLKTQKLRMRAAGFLRIVSPHWRVVAASMALAAIAVTGSPSVRADSPYSLRSPDAGISVQVQMPAPGSTETPQWSATFRGRTLLTGCHLSLAAADAGDLLAGVHVRSERGSSHDSPIDILFGKADHARDHYSEKRFSLENPRHEYVDVVFRCYDDAVAIRYEVPMQAGRKRLIVTEEGTSFGLADNPRAYVQYLENYRTPHEHNVTTLPLSNIQPDTLLDMPATFAWEDGTHLAITEAALRQYAGMSLMRPANGKANTLVCRLTPRPDGTKVVRELPMKTPWRVALVAKRAGPLLESNTLYCLNEPNAIGDTTWIKPGKLTFSWWNGNVVSNGKAEPPIFSMDAQKVYIDFCAANGLAFHSVIADNSDTPWYRQTQKGVFPGPDTDVTQVRQDLDLAAIRRYAASKGIRLWTWVHQAALRGRVEKAFSAFERFGWSGMRWTSSTTTTRKPWSSWKRYCRPQRGITF